MEPSLSQLGCHPGPSSWEPILRASLAILEAILEPILGAPKPFPGALLGIVLESSWKSSSWEPGAIFCLSKFPGSSEP